ncbi:hypothetical protein HYALB_00000911 [Hymenoscyphus albidus]|uniref:Uncharacterized protein n=1 Tax=Hymenoscyphus albidus TaxID=595503 RepID=A0A9N9LEB0_9HELO|nr:hypothetical protein HYALB_00000911 [Hymenoscyphus albidus]
MTPSSREAQSTKHKAPSMISQLLGTFLSPIHDDDARSDSNSTTSLQNTVKFLQITHFIPSSVIHHPSFIIIPTAGTGPFSFYNLDVFFPKNNVVRGTQHNTPRNPRPDRPAALPSYISSLHNPYHPISITITPTYQGSIMTPQPLDPIISSQ